MWVKISKGMAETARKKGREMSSLPLVGITMGDPAGIGPEIIVKAFAEDAFRDCRPVVLGDPNILSEAISRSGGRLTLNVVSSPGEAVEGKGTLNLVALSRMKERVHPGEPTLEGGRAMATYVVEAVRMIQSGELQAMTTGPINKLLMQQAGYRFEGHTQLIASLTGTEDYAMMLAGERLRVSLATIHCGLKDVPRLLTTEAVFKTIAITAKALKRDFGFVSPRLAVAALNPHGGESGLFGAEEEEVIEPAVKRARKEGYRAEGPFPADTLFHRAASGEFEAVVAMYHDQGLIPLKLLHFSDAVNVTLGLPIVRTSVDHGTAYDIAGKGRADASSLKAAVRLASRMVENRRKASRFG